MPCIFDAQEFAPNMDEEGQFVIGCMFLCGVSKRQTLLLPVQILAR